jgi:thiol-disulfide isomerase/thioredoxin
MGTMSEEAKRERPKIGEWNEEEAFAAFQGHIEKGDISKEELMKCRPWHDLPWKPHHQCKLRVGDDAPNSRLAKLDGSDCTMHEFLGGDDKPVVVMFGSITCPACRSMFLKELLDIVGEHKGKVDLKFVYLAEAHPKDGWHIGVNEKHETVLEQHVTIEQRRSAAKRFSEMYPTIEIAADTIDNNTDFHYEAQPSRIYVFYDKKIHYQSKLGPFQISPSSLQAFLWEWPVLKEE